jgi:hypothetical protein
VKSLHRYAVYGLVVAVEEPMESLRPATGSEGDPDITISFVDADYFRSIAPPEMPKAETEDWIAYALLANGSVYLRGEEVFELIVSGDGRRVACASPGSIDRGTFEAHLMNFVIGTSLTLQGEEPLHATVVDLGGQAVGLLGPSGAGQSTLAAYLISRGADLVTDDMLRVEFKGDSLIAHPGPYRLKLLDEPGRRFLPDALADGHFNSFSGKIMVQPRAGGRQRSAPVPLAGLYYIGDVPGRPESLTVTAFRLTGLELAKVVLSSAMDDRYTPPGRLAHQMAFIARLARTLPIYAIRYPRRFDVMDQVAAQIFAPASS